MSKGEIYISGSIVFRVVAGSECDILWAAKMMNQEKGKYLVEYGIDLNVYISKRSIEFSVDKTFICYEFLIAQS